jgi:hypothetical protein
LRKEHSGWSARRFLRKASAGVAHGCDDRVTASVQIFGSGAVWLALVAGSAGDSSLCLKNATLKMTELDKKLGYITTDCLPAFSFTAN